MIMGGKITHIIAQFKPAMVLTDYTRTILVPSAARANTILNQMSCKWLTSGCQTRHPKNINAMPIKTPAPIVVAVAARAAA